MHRDTDREKEDRIGVKDLCGVRGVVNDNGLNYVANPCPPQGLADSIKFDHGYTGSSPVIKCLLEVLSELDSTDQVRAYVLQI